MCTRSDRNYRCGALGRYRAGRAIMLLAAALAASPAECSELAQRHRAICHGDDRYRIEITGVAHDPTTCAKQNACFYYVLSCPDGRRYSLHWYRNPAAGPLEEFYAEQYPIAQLIIFGFLILYTAVAWGSGRRLKVPYFRSIWVPLTLTAGTLAVSTIPASSPPSTIGQFLVVGTVTLAVLFVTYAGIPIFLLSLGVPFVFGIPRAIGFLDFIFRRHPAEPALLSALRNRRAVDPGTVAESLTPKEQDLDAGQPMFRSQNQDAHARVLKDKLDADAELAEAIERRERARAALVRAQREVTDARRKGRGS